MVKYDVEFTDEARKFLGSLDEKTREKVFKTLEKVKMGLHGNFYSKMPGTDGLYECRVDSKDHWYRLLSKHYKKDDGTIIIVLSGFEKKENKIPSREIKKAEKIYKNLIE